MPQDEVKKVFDTYVFGFIFGDIQREVNLARSDRGGGNLLAALGLLCYTEFMGSFKTGRRAPSRKNFNAFLDSMRCHYKRFNRKTDVYRVFRCGMVHEYVVKGDCVIFMTRKPSLRGLGKFPDGRYYFVVEQYFEDFQAACFQTYRDLMSAEHPKLPQ
jgi:hypothetical protein